MMNKSVFKYDITLGDKVFLRETNSLTQLSSFNPNTEFTVIGMDSHDTEVYVYLKDKDGCTLNHIPIEQVKKK